MIYDSQRELPFEGDTDVRDAEDDRLVNEAVKKVKRLAGDNSSRVISLAYWWEGKDAAKKRSFIIEFAGMPKAGKSTAIKLVRQYFKSASKAEIADRSGKESLQDIKVDTPAEGVSQRTPSLLSGNLADFNTWAGSYALQILLRARHDTQHQLSILDRGPWDAGCWLRYVASDSCPNAKKKSYSDQEILQAADFFHLPMWSRLADLHVVLTVSPKKALERESRASLIKPSGASSESGMMKVLRELYAGQAKQLIETKISSFKNDESQGNGLCSKIAGKSVLLIDTTDLQPEEVAWQIIERTLEQVETMATARGPRKLLRADREKALTQNEVLSFVRMHALARGELTKIKKRIGPWVRNVNKTDGLPNALRAEIRKGSSLLDIGESGVMLSNVELGIESGSIIDSLEKLEKLCRSSIRDEEDV